MDAKELRIGNLVYEFVLGDVEIIELGRTHLEVSKGKVGDDICGLNYENIEPIPITPEWLARCGFTPCHINAGSWVLSPNDNLQIDYGIGFTYILDEDHAGPGLVDIKYVHQLQNLIYALTGEELQIKEKTN